MVCVSQQTNAAASHMMLPRTIFRLLNGVNGGPRLTVLIFHRVLKAPDPLFPGEADAARFDQILSWIDQWFTVLPLGEAVTLLQAGNLPPNALCITFDDGYADNYEVALPILLRHNMTATFFVASAYLDGGRMWNDTVIEAIRRCSRDSLDLSAIGLGTFDLATPVERRRAIDAALTALKHRAPEERGRLAGAVAEVANARLPDDLMMTAGQVRSLHREGMTIGAHTRTHPILAVLEEQAARDEIAGGRQDLEDIIRDCVDLFAYPNGRPGVDYLQRDVHTVRALGFSAAVTTAWGCARSGDDLYQIPRFTPWDRSRLRFGVRLIGNQLRERGGSELAV
jgi:peptidoglycan/xylan/chitin deacetylase (PgdA/CDA1 family)